VSALPTAAGPGWEVGEPPAAILAAQDARMRRIAPLLSTVSGVLFGGVVGFLIVFIAWPGANSWSLAARAELFLAFAVPFGLLDYLFMGFYIRMVSRATTLHVRRLSIADGKVRLERADGGTSVVVLKHLRVSEAPVAEAWHSVSYPAGRFAITFYVPADVAQVLRSSAGPTG
jgi:hypothetical protein